MRVLFERERDQRREKVLTDTYISGDSSLVQSAFKKTAHRHFCLGMAQCFELRLSKWQIM